MKAMRFLGLLTGLANRQGVEDGEEELLEDVSSEEDAQEDPVSEEDESEELLEGDDDGEENNDEGDEEEDQADEADLEEPAETVAAVEDDLLDGLNDIGDDDDQAEADAESDDDLVALPDDAFGAGVDTESDLYILASAVEDINIDELKAETASIEAFLMDIRAGVMPRDTF